MNSIEQEKSHSWEGYLKNVSLFLGIVSTLLTLFVAGTTYSISQKVTRLQEQNLELDAKIKKLSISNTSYENAVRLEAEFKVFNANAFAGTYGEMSVRMVWPDDETRADIEKYVGDWKSGRRLMTGASTSGLFVRQVICLRLINLGKTPARKVRLTVKQRQFDNQNGSQQNPYHKLEASTPGWEERQIDLGDLVEVTLERRMKTEIFIPLTHVSGSNKYFGRVAIPLKVTWHDERQDKDGYIDIDFRNDSALKNDINSSVLGRSRH